MTITGILRGIGKSLRPRYERKDVVITLDFEVEFTITEAEEDLNIGREIHWDYDHESVRKQIDEKIQQFVDDEDWD